MHVSVDNSKIINHIDVDNHHLYLRQNNDILRKHCHGIVFLVYLDRLIIESRLVTHLFTLEIFGKIKNRFSIGYAINEGRLKCVVFDGYGNEYPPFIDDNLVTFKQKRTISIHKNTLHLSSIFQVTNWFL